MRMLIPQTCLVVSTLTAGLLLSSCGQQDFVDPHEAGHAVLAAALTDFPQVQEDARCTIHATTGRMRGANESEKALIFDRTI